jgi:acetyl esterase/lipase
MKPRTYTFKVAGGCQIQADVYEAPGDGARPVIVWLHGGALITGSRKDIRPGQLELYTGAGCTLVSLDYRLAPETKLPAIIEDLQDGFRWVRDQTSALFPIDPDRIAVIGHSAGGYLTLMAGFCVRPRPSALISFYGYGDIAGPWYSRPDPFYCRQPEVTQAEADAAVGGQPLSNAEGPEHQHRGRYYLYCRQQGLWPKAVTGHDPDTEPAAFDRFCPVRNVTHEYPPTMLLHGDQDTDVPYEQSVIMAEALARAGVEHRLLTIPEGGHGFASRRDDPVVAGAFEQTVAFLRRHIGSTAEHR